MAKYQQYAEYKDSGVEWLGEIPKDWVASKFAYVKTVLTDFTANGSFADLKKNVIYRDEPSYARLVRLTDLRINLDDRSGVWIDEKAYNYLGKSALFGGEFLLANVGAHAGLFYQMPENKGNASLAPNMFMAKFDSNKVLREFIAYVAQGQSVNEQLRLNATASSAQPKLNKDDFKSVRFTYPSIEEQAQIANFLDHETAQIDTLIEKQQTLIQLLKEKRQAVISHAVTKGLNPDAPMKDSGVEWLGEVPEHWEVMKGAFIGQLFGSESVPENQVVKEGILPFIKVSTLSRDGFELQEPEWFVSARVAKNYKTRTSYVVFPKRGAAIFTNKVNVVNEPSLIDPNLMGWQINEKALSKYIALLLKTRKLDDIADVSTVPQINNKHINPEKFPLPPIKEQQEILDYIDGRLITFDDLIDKAEQAIQLMQERRTALISAAVTGKIDVRGWRVSDANYESH